MILGKKKGTEEDQEAPLSPNINITDGTLIPQKGEKGALSAWNISFFGAIAVILGLWIFSPDPYQRIIEFVPDGLAVTF